MAVVESADRWWCAVGVGMDVRCGIAMDVELPWSALQRTEGCTLATP